MVEVLTLGIENALDYPYLVFEVISYDPGPGPMVLDVSLSLW